jgi:hypothetical protein
MRSSERACGASHAVFSAEAVERGRTLLIVVTFCRLSKTGAAWLPR